MPIVGIAAFVVFFASGAFALFGGKAGVSSTGLNSLSHVCLAFWALMVFVLMIFFYRRESAATVGTFDLIESRKRNRGKWILNGAVAVPAGALVAWFAGYCCLRTINTYLSGPTTRHEATVASPVRFVGSYSCQEIEVRLTNGAGQWICTRRRPLGETVPANAGCAAAGDRAEVAEISTTLGKSLSLLSIDATSC